jgi:hypothetical protein
MTGARYAIRFDFPEADEPVYAGPYKGAAGFAPSLLTADLFARREQAEALLANGYGLAREFGRVVDLLDEDEA